MRKLSVILPLVVTLFALVAIACSNTPAAQPTAPNTPLPAPTAETPSNLTPVPPSPAPTVPAQGPITSMQDPAFLSDDEAAMLQQALNENRARWNSNQVLDYEFDYSRVCFCIPLTANITVRNTSIDTITNAESGIAITEDLEHYTTVDGLFNLIQSAIDLRVSNMTAEYDSELGYPTNVYIDYNNMMADEEGGFTISRLQTDSFAVEPPGPPTDPNAGLSQEVLNELQAELDANRDRWASHELPDYEFELRRICFCLRELVEPVIVSVRGGVIDSVTFAETGEAVDPDFSDLYPNIAGLFDTLQDAIDRKAANIEVSYDSEFGYPTNFFIDYNFMIADEELGFEASNLTSSGLALPPAGPEGNMSDEDAAAYQSELDENVVKWQTSGLSDYSFRFRVNCFCPPSITAPVEITVRDWNSIDSITRVESGEPVTEFTDVYLTVGGLFDFLQEAIDRRVDRIDVSYHPEFGYPTEVFVDRSFLMADEERGFVASELQAVEPLTLDEIQARLDASRDRWESSGPSNYEIEYRRVCFCAPNITDPVIVSIRNGVRDSVVYAGTGETVGEAVRDFFPDVNGMFEVLQDAIDQGAARISASYHPAFGYPADVYIDYSFMIADEELGFSITSLEVPASASIGGHWEGTILVGAQELGILVDFIDDDAGLRATIDIPDQFVDDLPLGNVSFDDPAIRFEIIESQAVFDGVLAGDTISGDYEQFGVSATFALARAELLIDTPIAKEPVPYTEEEVGFQNGDITLAGTLTLPPGDGPHPAAVMITGSGAQNRDEEIVGFKIFAVIADYLTRNGIAVLRYDDRGVGGSTGTVNESTLDDFSNDVLSAVDLLKARDDINAGQIGLVGHSEGGIVGPLAASQTGDVAYLVLIAGTGVPGHEILVAQLELISSLNGASKQEIEQALENQQLAFNAIRTGEGWDELLETARQEIRDSLDDLPESQRAAITDVDTFVNTVADQQIQAVQSPWFASFLDYDPGLVLETTTIPVLALFGGLDIQVPVDQNRPAIEQALEAAGNGDVTVEVFDPANHLFQTAITGNISEYPTLEKDFVPGFLNTISDWILARVDVAVQ